MARFLIIIFTAATFFSVYSLIKNRKMPVSNERFDFKAYQNNHEAKEQLLVELQKEKYLLELGALAAPEAKTEEFKIVLETEEEKNGQATYEKRCVVCHGKMGEGKKSQNAPKLGGQFDWYVYTQLVAMKDKKRINKVMDPYLKPLVEKDLKEISAYVAKLPW